MNKITFLIPLLPFIGFLINGLGRKSLSKSAIGIIACGTVLLSFIFSIILFFHVKNTGGNIFSYFNFININNFIVPFAFQIDALSALFLLIITGVGLLIHVYSIAYMNEEEPHHFGRYFAYMNLFIFSMLLLVMGANYVIMFIEWEGVGLCSYLLIGFWFKNNDYNYAAKKAFIMNRIGDVGFLLAIFWLVAKLGTTNFVDVFSHTSSLTPFDVTAITILLFVGATGKSAQIPLYTWLPDAMAGPTPVSALIHAATMVTAGIYMIARSHVLYSLSEITQHLVAIIGLATALLAATIALKQNDIKKVLAYSTISQLGYMFLGLGVGAYTGAVFHVMTHAFFKALLFLGAGSVIKAMHHEQDIRKMGGLKKRLPITHITFLFGCIAISGIPPFSGFFSKDEILAAAYAKNPVYWYVGVATAALTAFYMFRLYAITFLGNFRGTKEDEEHVHESSKTITYPLIALAVLSLIGGFFNVPESLWGNHALQNFLSPVLTSESSYKMPPTTEWWLMIVSVLVAAAAIIFAVNKFTKQSQTSNAKGFGKFLENKWYVDELYNTVFVKTVSWKSKFLTNTVEKKGIDAGVNGVGKLVQYGSRQLRLLQNGLVGNYILFMLIAIIVMVLVWINDGTILRFIVHLFM